MPALYVYLCNPLPTDVEGGSGIPLRPPSQGHETHWWGGGALLFPHILRYTLPMIIEQTVEIPANHRLTLEVPREIPACRAVLAFTPEKQGAAL